MSPSSFFTTSTSPTSRTARPLVGRGGEVGSGEEQGGAAYKNNYGRAAARTARCSGGT